MSGGSSICEAHVLARCRSDGHLHALMEAARRALAATSRHDDDEQEHQQRVAALAPPAEVTCECWAVAPPGSARLPRALWRPSVSSPIWFVRDGPTTHAIVIRADGDAGSIETVPIGEAGGGNLAFQAQIRQFDYVPWASVRFTGAALVQGDGVAAARVLTPRLDVGGGTPDLVVRPHASSSAAAAAVAQQACIDVRAPVPADALVDIVQKHLDGAVVVGGGGTRWESDDPRSIVAASAAIARKFAFVADAVLMGR